MGKMALHCMLRARRVVMGPRFPLVVVGLAVLVRVGWIIAVRAEPVNDFRWYYGLGLRIASGEGYIVDDDGFPLWKLGHPLLAPRPTAFWPVGYPAFLGVVFYLTGWLVPPLLAAKLANVVLYCGILVCTSYCTRIVFRSELAGRLALLFLAFLPNHIAYTSLTSVEIFYAFLVVAGSAAIMRAREQGSVPLVAVAGVIFALAVHTKPQSILLPGLLIAVMSFRDRRALLSHSVILYTVLSLCLVPWLVRNYHAFGRPVFISNNGGINLLIGNMPGSWGDKGLMWNQELEDIISTQEDEVVRDGEARRVGTRYITSHIPEVLMSVPKKFFRLYAVDVDGFGWNREAVPELGQSPLYTPLRAVAQVYYLAMLGLAAAAVVKLRRSSGYWFVGPAVFLYFSLVHLVFFGGARFHFPVMPWIVAYAAGMIAAVLQQPRRHSEPAMAEPIAA
jgi:hypothetical protein